MTRILCSIFLLITLSFIGYSQDVSTVKKNRLKKLYIAPSAGVEILSIKNYVSADKGFSVVYKGVPSIKAGLDAEYRTSEKLIVHTGLFYSSKNFNRTETNTEGNAEYFYDQKFKNRYIETLIGGAFNFVTSRLDVAFYTDLNFSFLLSATETRLTETGNKFINNNKPTYHKVLSILEPGFNFNYNINYRLSFGLKTGYRFYLNSISIDKKFSNNGVLIQSGLFYKF